MPVLGLRKPEILLFKNLQSSPLAAMTRFYQGLRRQEWQALVDFYRWAYSMCGAAECRTGAALATSLSLGAIVACRRWQDPYLVSLIVPENWIRKVRDDTTLIGFNCWSWNLPASTSIMMNNLSCLFGAVG